jgi:type I restriction enzyme S subunit
VNATLGSICHFLNGGTPSKDVEAYFRGDIPWITSADITGPVVDTARSFITPAAVQKSATNKVAKGTVLLVTRTGVGKVAMAGCELCFSQDITAIIPDSSRLDTAYLVHFLRTKQNYFERSARGATIKGITRDVVTEASIPLPPLPEQRRIAAILDQADALRVKRREALAQLDKLAQAIFVEMFGNVSASDWSIATIGDVAQAEGGIRTGPFGSQLLHSEFVDEGVAVLGIDNAVTNEFEWGERRFITEAKYRALKRYTVHPGDVLMLISMQT